MNYRIFSRFLIAFTIPYLAAATVEAASDTSADRAAPRTVAPSVADHDGNRLSDGLEAKLSALGRDDTVDVIVTFAAPGTPAEAARAVGPFAVRTEFSIIPGFAARMTAGQARSLARIQNVRRVEEDALVHATDVNTNRDFGVERIQAAPSLGGLGLTGAGIGICVVDTGIFAEHEQFVDDAGASKVVGFADFVNRRTAPYDDQGHGTHVSGIAAADGTGVPANEAAPFIGVAPGALLYGAKVLDANGSGRTSNVIRGVEWCAGQPGVDVINLSLGGDGNSDGGDSLSLAVNNAVDVGGKVVVVAAGNAGATQLTIGTPAAAARAITVGATAEWSSSLDRVDWWSSGPYLTPFSSRGPTADGRIKPDVAAPGHTVASAYINPFASLGVFPCTTDCYTVLSGTSMAAPFTAGVTALMLEAGGGALSPEGVRQALFESTQPRGAATGKDSDWGFGMIDPWGATNLATGSTVASHSPTAFPAYRHEQGAVADHGLFSLDLEVIDMSVPMSVTVTIDGEVVKSGRIVAWQPDLEARLLKPDGSDAAFWLFIDSTDSRCPAIGAECGRLGRQETLYVAPPLVPAYRLEVWPAEDTFNEGRGGTFVVEISNGRVAGTTDPAPGSLLADAGPDRSVTDDGDGFVELELDGSASGPFGTITTYVWSWSVDGVAQVLTGIAPTVTLPVGTHEISLTVTDTAGAADTDTLSVTVVAGKGGGAKGGPKKNNGGRGGLARSGG